MKHLLQLILLLAMPLMASACHSESSKESQQGHLQVKHIDAKTVEAEDVPALLQQAEIPFQSIGTVNWSSFPYRPDVKFRIAYTPHALLLHYWVTEASVRALYAQDGEAVWSDSCVEFFSIPGGDGVYYNIECNCIGTILMQAGTERSDRQSAPEETTALIKRWASLGNQPFEERIEETTWEVALVIPYEVFFQHSINSLEGRNVAANFYKCGSGLQTPHYLTWNPVGTTKPDFHQPLYFGLLSF